MVCLYLSWNLVHSRWGRAYQAIRESELAAGAAGVPTYWAKVSAFAISAGWCRWPACWPPRPSLQVTMADGHLDRRSVVQDGDPRLLRRPRHDRRADRRGLRLHARAGRGDRRLVVERAARRVATLVVLGVLVICSPSPCRPGRSASSAGARRRGPAASPAPPAREVDLHPSHRHEPGSVLLELRGVTQTLRWAGRPGRHRPRGACRHGARPHRPERFGQDHAGQRHDRPVPPVRRRRCCFAGPRPGGRLAAPLHPTRGVARTFQTCHIWRR